MSKQCWGGSRGASDGSVEPRLAYKLGEREARSSELERASAERERVRARSLAPGLFNEKRASDFEKV